MLSEYINRKLEAIEHASKNEVRVKDISRLMNHPAIWFQAYANCMLRTIVNAKSGRS